MIIIMMNSTSTEPCCEDKKPEVSKAVEILADMVREIMRKIRDADGVDKQQKMLLQFFKFLGGVKSLEDAAQKMLSVAIKEDAREVADEAKDEE
jgi:hypothetical protein